MKKSGDSSHVKNHNFNTPFSTLSNISQHIIKTTSIFKTFKITLILTLHNKL